MRFFLVWRVWGRAGKYLFSDTAAEAGILSIATPPVDVSENKYFPVLYNGNGFAGGENGKVLDIGRKMQCMGVQEWKITGFGKGVL